MVWWQCLGRDTACRDRDRACRDRDRACRDRDTACRDRDTACRDRDRACRDKERETNSPLVKDFAVGFQPVHHVGGRLADRAQVLRVCAE